MKKKGISPVIATVILIAVAVAIAIAVAFWASGLVGSFTRFEKMDIINYYATRNSGDYIFTINMENAGPSEIVIQDIFVNGEPLNSFWSAATVNGSSFSSISINPGQKCEILVMFPDNNGVRAFSSGQTVEISVQTSSGVHYVGTFLLS
ncbi:MAG: archaellin/type IV pilin N-terminal domain-containing protein [Nitrososphaeria archaeon]|jgi:flagellin-like protein